MISNNALEAPTVSKRNTCESMTCWNCGEMGHFAKGCATNFCTLPSQEATSTETINTAIQADESSEPIAKLQREDHHADVTLLAVNPIAAYHVVSNVGGKNINFMLDTGASVSLISECTWKVITANRNEELAD